MILIIIINKNKKLVDLLIEFISLFKHNGKLVFMLDNINV